MFPDISSESPHLGKLRLLDNVNQTFRKYLQNQYVPRIGVCHCSLHHGDHVYSGRQEEGNDSGIYEITNIGVGNLTLSQQRLLEKVVERMIGGVKLMSDKEEFIENFGQA